MSAPVLRAPLPPLPEGNLQNTFDRLQSLLQQHAQLSAETAEEVSRLSEMCESHFRDEEESQLGDDLCAEAPWLNRKLQDAIREHNALRQRLTSLIRCSQRQQPLPRPWMEFAEELSFFRRQLNTHESDERELWQQVYTRDVGTKD